MSFWECFWSLMPYVAGLVIFFGVIYPAAMVIMYKLAGSKLSVREILKKI